MLEAGEVEAPGLEALDLAVREVVHGGVFAAGEVGEDALDADEVVKLLQAEEEAGEVVP